MPIFKGTRQLVIYEDVEVEAANYSEAYEKILDDEDVLVNSERESDYEINGRLTEEKD